MSRVLTNCAWVRAIADRMRIAKYTIIIQVAIVNPGIMETPYKAAQKVNAHFQYV